MAKPPKGLLAKIQALRDKAGKAWSLGHTHAAQKLEQLAIDLYQKLKPDQRPRMDGQAWRADPLSSAKTRRKKGYAEFTIARGDFTRSGRTSIRGYAV